MAKHQFYETEEDPQYIDDMAVIRRKDELKELRIQAGFRSQQAAADFLQMSVATWNSWESHNLKRHRNYPKWVPVVLRLIIANRSGIRFEGGRYGS